MAEVNNLKQVLVQALAVERKQEKARRQSEIDQQRTTRRLIDQAEIHGRQVEEAPEPEALRLDPDQERRERPEDRARRRAAQAEEPSESPEEDPEQDGESAPRAERKGRRIDLQA
jgi:hypothetical protein